MTFGEESEYSRRKNRDNEMPVDKKINFRYENE